MSVDERTAFNTLEMFVNIQHGCCPLKLVNNLVWNNNVKQRETRSSNEYAPSKFKKTITQKSLFYKEVKLFNSFIKQKNQSDETFHQIMKNFVRKIIELKTVREINKQYKIRQSSYDYEKLFNCKPQMSFHEFGCKVFVMIPQQRRKKKLDKKSRNDALPRSRCELERI